MASVTTDPEDNCLPNDQIVNISAWQLLLSLRLLKRGLIGLSRIVSIPNFDQRHGLVNASYSLADFSIEISLRERNSAILYSLKWGELPFLMKIIESLNAGSEKDRQEMQIAFSRFNLAYQRDRAEDRIIDFTVALENLLLWGTDQELQYRLTLRGAAILAKTENPSEVKTRLEAVYFVRSKIVHEGRTLQDFVNDKTLSKRFQKLVPGKQPQDLPEICEDITRSIINFYLEHLAQGKSIEAIHSDIDLKIINGLSVTDAKDNEGV